MKGYKIIEFQKDVESTILESELFPCPKVVFAATG
jgi:hypothetical protein